MNIGEEIVKFIDDTNKLYKETQEMNRFELVKMIYDLKAELDIANKKLEKIREKTEFDMKMWSKEDGFILINGNELLSIIGE